MQTIAISVFYTHTQSNGEIINNAYSIEIYAHKIASKEHKLRLYQKNWNSIPYLIFLYKILRKAKYTNWSTGDIPS